MFQFKQKYNVEEQEPGNRFLLQPREADYTTTTDGKNLYDLDPMKNVDPDEKMCLFRIHDTAAKRTKTINVVPKQRLKKSAFLGYTGKILY